MAATRVATQRESSAVWWAPRDACCGEQGLGAQMVRWLPDTGFGELGLTAVRVPAHSLHAVGLKLALNREIRRVHARLREGNPTLDGLPGFDVYRRTVGIVGTGRIGNVVARILQGFGCLLLAHDLPPHHGCQAIGMTYVPRSA